MPDPYTSYREISSDQMTIVSKDAASSSGVAASSVDSKSTPNYQPLDGVIGPPPSYAETQSGAGPSTMATPELPRPTNFVSLGKPLGPIKDIWVVDTNLQIPEALLPPLGLFSGVFSTRPNLTLSTAHGSIKADVFLVSSGSDRALIKADTQWGPLSFKISRLGSKQPFKLSADTKYGNIIIGLSRDFVGPLKYKTAYGKITFSPQLKTDVFEISGENAFVGDYKESQFVDYKSWRKDEVAVETGYGNISFMYVDEVPPEGPSFEKRVEATVNSVLGWFGLR